jgi:hypothetical protein
MKTLTSEMVKVELDFTPDVFVAMQMIGLYGDKLERDDEESNRHRPLQERLAIYR